MKTKIFETEGEYDHGYDGIDETEAFGKAQGTENAGEKRYLVVALG